MYKSSSRVRKYSPKAKQRFLRSFARPLHYFGDIKLEKELFAAVEVEESSSICISIMNLNMVMREFTERYAIKGSATVKKVIAMKLSEE